MEELTIACQLHQKGIRLIPVDPESRRPLVPWGDIDRLGYRPGGRLHVGEALPYSSLLFEWWHKWPGAGAAVLCGLSGLLVIDCDPRHGGREGLRELAAEIELPATFTIRTRHQGIHLYYRAPTLVKSTTGKLGKGLDVLSAKKLAVCPPTRGYEIIDPRPIAPAPAELLARCPKPDRGGSRQRERLPLDDPGAQAALEHALRRIREATPGERHDRTYGMARWLFGVTTDAAVDAMLLGAALEAGLLEAEAQRCIGDARRKAGA